MNRTGITARPATWSTRPTPAEQAGLALRTALRSAFSRWGAVAVVGIALLGAFQHVVGESVLRGRSLSRAMATQNDELGRCNALRVAQDRAECRGRMDRGTAPGRAAALSADSR